QYDGDFWGLYLAVEQMDGAFLDEHGLPDGNLYKMEGGSGELNNQGATGATNRSDLNDFLRTYQSSNPPVAWWRENLSLDRYYGYRSIVEAVHHYDIADGKNYFYYLHPTTGAWSVHAWDVDLTWADNMYGSGNEPFRSRVLAHAELAIEYRNRLREIRDLLYNPAEMARLLEELAAIIDNPALDQTIVDADRAKWDYNPVMADGSIVNLSKAGQGRFYQRAASRTFRGMVDLMKSYVVSRGAFIDNNILTDDAQIPNRPTISATGPGDFPADRLTFRASAFSDPQGNHTFGALEWRLADVTDPDPGVPFVRGRPKPREINAVWESGEIEEPVLDIAIPPEVVGVGRRYRVRVRMRDASGRFSHWSEPLELTTSAPRDPLPQAAGLRVTEVHFHPFGGEDEEFIEIQNIGPVPLDLEHVS
ncbi:MAG TPA: CotH kinase family protein, partial [Planctomycetota bacterium]|nr:CotH kinase family protein [Planctomycetota bacterium]